MEHIEFTNIQTYQRQAAKPQQPQKFLFPWPRIISEEFFSRQLANSSRTEQQVTCKKQISMHTSTKLNRKKAGMDMAASKQLVAFLKLVQQYNSTTLIHQAMKI